MAFPGLPVPWYNRVCPKRVEKFDYFKIFLFFLLSNQYFGHFGDFITIILTLAHNLIELSNNYLEDGSVSRSDKKVNIFSALEVANICGVVNQTAINWIRNGHLKAFTTPGGQYRIYAEDLVDFLNARGMRIPEDVVSLLENGVNWSSLLIVDDDENLNNMLKKWLNRNLPDMEVLQAFDGFEAGHVLAEERPGFILLDIDLPGVDGHLLCKRIKEDPSFGKPFVIAITGLDIPEEKEAIMEDGADAFFAKPLDFDKLLASIEGLVQKVVVGEEKSLSN